MGNSWYCSFIYFHNKKVQREENKVECCNSEVLKVHPLGIHKTFWVVYKAKIISTIIMLFAFFTMLTFVQRAHKQLWKALGALPHRVGTLKCTK